MNYVETENLTPTKTCCGRAADVSDVPATREHRPGSGARHKARSRRSSAWLALEEVTPCINIAACYYIVMIKSFKCKETKKIFGRKFSKKLPTDIQVNARQKLVILDAATSLDDLRVPPGNRLEELKDDRKGQHSIRINSQWRICFEWKNNDSHNVEIVDYH